MSIKSFSIFESNDKGYFKDMEDEISEDFPEIKIKAYSDNKSGILEIYFLSNKMNFIKFVNLLDFWIEVLNENKYRFSDANMSVSREFNGHRNKRFENWKGMRKYILQFGGQEYSSIRSMNINFN